MKHRRRLEAYCALLEGAPVSVTAVRERSAAWKLHVVDALTALPVIAARGAAGAIDVGSGGGSPGIPIAIEAELPVALLEARGPKVAFLRRAAAAVGAPCEVLHGRSEELARGAGRDGWDVAFARALAPPPAAAELCLPLVRPGGCVVLWTTRPDVAAIDAVATVVAGRVADVVRYAGERALVVVEKLAPTPEAFPRRPGVALRRPPPSLRSRP